MCNLEMTIMRAHIAQKASMMKRDPDTFPENAPSTFGEFEDDFDYFDENPDEDPFMPKPTCFHCEGLGVITLNDRDFTCTFCGGTGALK